MKLAIVGATGMVGREMIQVVHERNLPYTQLLLAANRSAGETLTHNGKQFKVQTTQGVLDQRPDVALFSAGGDASKEWAPKFAAAGCIVIDNSSAWRMEPHIKLVVPEVNGQVITERDKIIANPNCSTIQLVMVLQPLHKAFGIRRVIVSTYQSVTGTGKEAVDQLMAERAGGDVKMKYPYRIDLNVLPHCDVFTDNGYTKEEMKLTHETKKILGDDNVWVSATAVRVPVVGGHSEAVNIEFENHYDLARVAEILAATPGVKVLNDASKLEYPMPLLAHGKDEVLVGRIRADVSHPKALNLFIVADNLRKGAATNAVQIAEYLLAKNLIGATPVIPV
jgi:aspartate-semialdehyde dehydrogenase